MLSHLKIAIQGILTVVDVFSEWAGPCNAMQNYLKKIKLEVSNNNNNDNDNDNDNDKDMKPGLACSIPVRLHVKPGEEVEHGLQWDDHVQDEGNWAVSRSLLDIILNNLKKQSPISIWIKFRFSDVVNSCGQFH